MKNLTIVDIAQLSNVSISTVSRVINKHPDVSHATREKVLAIIEDNIYVPNNSARDLKRESLKAILVIVKGFSNPFFDSMVPFIQGKLENNRYAMIMHQLDTLDDEISAAIALCKEKKPRGLIFMGGSFTHSSEKLSMIGVPFVTLTFTMQKETNWSGFSSVTIDDYQEGYYIGDRLCKMGHTKFAAIASNQDDMSISKLRINGFLKALRDNNIEAGEERVSYSGGFTRKAGYDGAKHLLSTVDFTCLFCISDILALGAVRAIHDSGFAIPKDISVVGFDGLDEGIYSIPSLTTLRQPGKKMAEKSVDILLNQLRTGAEHLHLTFDGEFIEGESFMPLHN